MWIETHGNIYKSMTHADPRLKERLDDYMTLWHPIPFNMSPYVPLFILTLDLSLSVSACSEFHRE